MKKYQMPNVEFVQINAMQVIMESPTSPTYEDNPGTTPTYPAPVPRAL